MPISGRFWPGLLILTVAAVCADQAAGEPWQPDDFAWGIELIPPDDSGLLAVDLPAPFYTGVARADAADFRIFNADNRPLAYRIRRKSPKADTPMQRTLPLFPLYVEADVATDSISLQFKRGAGGSLIDIQGPSAGPSEESRLAGYILDNSRNTDGEQWMLTELEFKLQNAGQVFTQSVTIERSNDLQHWSTLVDGAVLSKLEFRDQQLEKTTIALPETQARYLRVSWDDSDPALELRGVTATLVDRRHDLPLRWSDAVTPPEPAPEGSEVTGNAYTFSTGGFFPVRRIELQAGSNEFYRGTLYSRTREIEHWQYRTGFTQYRYQTPEGEIHSQPIHMLAIRDPQWLLKFHYPAEPGDHPLPSIRFAWSPERVIFLAQGEGPYLLAFGNPRVDRPAGSGRELVDALKANDTPPVPVRTGERRTLGGRDKLKAPPEPFPWETLTLWAVLIGGVGLMIGMAVTLYRQMNGRQNTKK
jgi:hypothetical protein